LDQKTVIRALEGLRTLIGRLNSANVTDRASWRDWRNTNYGLMEEALQYMPRTRDMPVAPALVKAFFHPTLPLIGLNYTPVAHNTLHNYPGGWTPAIRLCRGIVFDRFGNLVAKPFEKFFNHGEQPESTDLPDGPFTATVKYDGHLGIVFEHGGHWHVTTRGDFTSRTSKVAGEMLRDYVRDNKWTRRLDYDINPLVEVINPSTKVHLKYRSSRFILIGAYDRKTLHDFDYSELRSLGRLLGLPVTERWQGESVADLVGLMADLTVKNREGFVARFEGGLRVKFKFASYINLMVASKLSMGYVLNRILSGTTEKMFSNLPEEIRDEANRMVESVLKVALVAGTEKERRQYLYSLLPAEQSTQYYRGLCRKVIAKLDTSR
jgi:RNA ligase